MRKTFLLAISAALALATAPAQAADEALIAAAKKEGAVTWYTTLIADQLGRPIAGAFEKKYGIKVANIRAGDQEIMLRLYNEARAGKPQGDIFDTASSSLRLKAEGLVMKWVPDAVQKWPKEYADPDGYWTPMALYVEQPGFNTNLVKQQEAPRSFNDFLDPKWKGKLAWNGEPATTGAPGFIGSVLRAMGDDKGKTYLRELSRQNIIPVPGGARRTFDMVIAGEYPMALQMLNHHAFFSANAGAPAGWSQVNDAMAFFLVMNVVQGSPNPNAGKLLADFIASDEGQGMFRDAGYIPVNPAVAPRDPTLKPDNVNFRVNYFTPQQIDAGMPQWIDLYKEIFR